MKMIYKSIDPPQHRTRVTIKPQLMVSMTLQPLLQVCTDAVASCISAGLHPSEKISIDPSVNIKIRLWLDTALFTEALVDLLGEAARRCERGSEILVSVSSTGIHGCRLNISYFHKKIDKKSNDEPFVLHYHSNSRTREIVTQHQAAVSLRETGRNVTIEVWFP
jgi:hypothetical protein